MKEEDEATGRVGSSFRQSRRLRALFQDTVRVYLTEATVAAERLLNSFLRLGENYYFFTVKTNHYCP